MVFIIKYYILRLFTHLKQDDHGNRPTHCGGGDRDSSGFAAKKKIFLALGSHFPKRLRRCDPARAFEFMSGPFGPGPLKPYRLIAFRKYQIFIVWSIGIMHCLQYSRIGPFITSRGKTYTR